jgi:hypothetical protein
MTRFLMGFLVGAALGTLLGAFSGEPEVTVRNGPLAGWQVVRDDETLLCEDPMVFVRARQIECP